MCSLVDMHVKNKPIFGHSCETFGHFFLAGTQTSSTRFNLIKCEGREESMCAHSLICMRKTNTLSRELMVVLTVNQRGPQNQFTFHLIQLRS